MSQWDTDMLWRLGRVLKAAYDEDGDGDPFDTVCIDGGERSRMRRPTVPAEDGNLLHVRCGDEVTYTPAERDRIAEIDLWRNDLEKGIAGALAELRAATDAAGELSSNRVCDVEFAEGCGADIVYHFDVAARALRAADALRHRVVTAS